MRIAAFGVLGVLAASAAVAQIQDTRPLNPRDLRPVASFSAIADQGERSRALFNEIAKVITHPRCMNCHPAAACLMRALISTGGACWRELSRDSASPP